MTEETFTNVSAILALRFPSSYFESYKEEKIRNEGYEDDGFIHIQRYKYRHTFYLEPQGKLSAKDIPRFEKAVDKARKQVTREIEVQI